MLRSGGRCRRRKRVISGDAEFAHGTNFDTAIFRRRNPRGNIQGLVEIFRVDQIEACQQLFRLGKWAVIKRDLPIAHANRRRRVHRMKRFGGNQAPAFRQPAGKGFEQRLTEPGRYDITVLDDSGAYDRISLSVR